jgi:hypothetical protein
MDRAMCSAGRDRYRPARRRLLLRSVDVVFPVLVVLGLIGTCAMGGHQQLRPRLDKDPALVRRVATRTGWAGVVLVLAGLLLALTLTGPDGSDIWGPAVLTVGFAATAYVFGLGNSRTPSGGTGCLAVVTGMTLVAFVWTLTAYADYIGVQKAEETLALEPGADEHVSLRCQGARQSEGRAG